ncbi:tail fiber domain-containing protein [Pedobacter sp. AW31-3R]|uniref:tail fiber domain-containing protein n=1 Tax=Pedobacter sp. AW31-3R TaxID=3445781 RepID=UPI003F9FD5FA
MIKPLLIGALLITGTLKVSAQKIDGQELQINVSEIDGSAAKLMKLKPVTFQYDLKKYPELKLTAGKKYGFLVGEVKAEFPELVAESAKSYTSGKNNMKTLRYDEVQQDHLIPLLVAAVKEQQQEIEILKRELATMKAQKDTSAK